MFIQLTRQAVVPPQPSLLYLSPGCVVAICPEGKGSRLWVVGGVTNFAVTESPDTVRYLCESTLRGATAEDARTTAEATQLAQAAI